MNLPTPLGRAIHRRQNEAHLARNTHNIHHGPLLLARHEMPNRQLRQPDRMREINIQQLVPRVRNRVRRPRRSRRDPEVAKGLLEDPGAGTHYVDGAESFLGGRQGGLELCPGRHVTLLEYSAGAVGAGADVVGGGEGGGGDEVVGFGPEGQVGDEDVAALGDEGFGEAQVDSLGVQHGVSWRGR
jgi:hypothetical protein